MTFIRSFTLLGFNYKIHGLSAVYASASIRNFGSHLLENLSPRLLIEDICCKALKLLSLKKVRFMKINRYK